MAEPGAAPPLFELRRVSFSIEGRALVAALDLTLQPGRTYGLIGPNGSGKSTLVKMLARQQRPSEGEIRFEGRPLESWGARDLARRLAYMPQFTPPADGMTVRELVALGRYPWHGALGRITAADRERVEGALRSTGLQSFATRLVDSLSGGERQRAWLAMMLAQDARCLLLDEPTSALDVAHQVEVLALVRWLAREAGISVVLVLHDVNMAARYCDEILALGSGRLAARGTPDEIMQPRVLGEIYGLPMGIVIEPTSGAAIGYPA